jgi:hypothetical protein
MTLGGLRQELRKLANILFLLAKDLFKLLTGQVFQVARESFVSCFPERETRFVF